MFTFALQRKHEEVSQLRKKQRDSSSSSRVMEKNRANLSQRNKVSVASAKPTPSVRVQQKTAMPPLFSDKVIMLYNFSTINSVSYCPSHTAQCYLLMPFPAHSRTKECIFMLISGCRLRNEARVCES